MSAMTQTSDPVVIASYARTPMGGFQGVLSAAKATELGATAVRAAVQRSGVDPTVIDQIIMGCVLPAGLGQAPARQAALGAGLPKSVEATTVNKMCGSGMQAAIMAHDALAAGSVDVIVAGGMESMSNAPYLMTKHRGGARIGHDTISDSMYLDGLEDAYEPGRLMGSFAEDSARTYQFTREDQDAYAIESLSRARAATESGAFAAEITPVTVKTRKGEEIVNQDEQPMKADPTKIPGLKPAFATVREAAKRTLGQRHFDVQLIGGMVLHEGDIAEMKTGEGKTLVATLAVYLNALAGKGVHVVTVNDYLAKRDSGWMGQIYGFLGLTTGVIVHGLDDSERQAAYACDITYGTNNEYGFDYLRDNMKYRLEDMVQRGHFYAIVDEVDSILIDEARTPLIISGPLDDRSEFYNTIDTFLPKLEKKTDFD
eukprot:gene37193-50186_t